MRKDPSAIGVTIGFLSDAHAPASRNAERVPQVSGSSVQKENAFSSSAASFPALRTTMFRTRISESSETE